ncbi:MAG: carbohydrate ABC transporter permease [Candidatus Methanosuratus sp.]|nr:carbohydrate ABC transporter permease [Candidatus Methanosuratincola sp.]
MLPIRNRVARFFIYLALSMYTVTMSFPLLWAVLQSLKNVRQANSLIPVFIFKPTLESYAKLWFREVPENLPVLLLGAGAASLALILLAVLLNRRGVSKLAVIGLVVVGFSVILWAIPRYANTADWYDFFVNTLIVTVCSVTISVCFSAAAGYAIARYQRIGGAVILIVALALGSLPAMAFAMPYYQLSSMLGLQDSYILLIAVMVGLHQPFSIWMLRGFFLEIPRDIDESAMIDGASPFRVFWSVVAPIAWSGIITSALLNALGVYHSFLIVRVLTRNKWTLAVAMSKYVSTLYAAEDTVPFAAAVSASIPLLILVFFCQEQLIKGLGAGAVKG